MILIVRLIVIAFVMVGCATTSNRTTGPETFLGQWEGVWRSSLAHESGGVDLAVTQRDDKFRLNVGLTNSRFPRWSVDATFKDGMLVVERPDLRMEIWLHVDDRLEAIYDVKSGDRGYWSLKKKL